MGWRQSGESGEKLGHPSKCKDTNRVGLWKREWEEKARDFPGKTGQALGG